MRRSFEFLYLHQRLEILYGIIGHMSIDIKEGRRALDQLIEHVDRSRPYLSHYTEIQRWFSKIQGKKWNALCYAFDDFLEQVRPIAAMIGEDLIRQEIQKSSSRPSLPKVGGEPTSTGEEESDGGDDETHPVGS